MMSIASRLSIVIPVGPDDQSWQNLLKNLVTFDSGLDIILTACQDLPATVQLPDNVNWLSGTQGRAEQLNRGAEHARHDVIWFLHADTQASKECFKAANQFIADSSPGLAFFRLKFAADGPGLTRLNAWAANIRSGFFRLPFGDQGFIIRKTLFQQQHGFDETVKLGEDLDFVVRLQAAGVPLQELPAELITSARRYRQQGWLLTTFKHVWLTWFLTRQAKQRLAEI